MRTSSSTKPCPKGAIRAWRDVVVADPARGSESLRVPDGEPAISAFDRSPV
jgi:hypothetical protein